MLEQRLQKNQNEQLKQLATLEQRFKESQSDQLTQFALLSSNSFYFDQTDKKPLPPERLEFLLKARGFASSEILALHSIRPG
jgi:hypothetical protein